MSLGLGRSPWKYCSRKQVQLTAQHIILFIALKVNPTTQLSLDCKAGTTTPQNIRVQYLSNVQKSKINMISNFMGQIHFIPSIQKPLAQMSIPQTQLGKVGLFLEFSVSSLQSVPFTCWNGMLI